MLLNEFNTINFSPSCARNQQAIFEQLSNLLPAHANVLEIGSYSGQHAVHICQQLNNISWQPSDQAHYQQGLAANLALANLANVLKPITLDVSKRDDWPKQCFDLIFTANSLHIMSFAHVQMLFTHLAQCLARGSIFAIYGPFKYQNAYTSASNRQFQQWLQARDPLSGIRDFEEINRLAQNIGLSLQQDIAMPANNQLLVFKKISD